MQLTDHVMLVTGGGSGIGRGLAEAFHQRGNQVVIAGRDRAKLDAVCAANPGMRAMQLDIADAAQVQSFAQKIAAEFPRLNAVIHAAGIMKTEHVKDAELADAEAMIATNLLGTIRLTAALLPHFLAQAHATVMTVSSGLAFVPLNLNPTYCATKAAVHSYTQSLRYQLKDSAVEVLELVPPYVQTYLTGPHQAHDPMAMPLSDYLEEVMGIIEQMPEATEICVERVKPLRFAEASGEYGAFYKKMNDTLTEIRTKRVS